MKRRDFLKVSASGAALAGVASPAIAQSSPEIKWRMTSSFPKSLDTIYGGAVEFAKYVAEMTDNNELDDGANTTEIELSRFTKPYA